MEGIRKWFPGEVYSSYITLKRNGVSVIHRAKGNLENTLGKLIPPLKESKWVVFDGVSAKSIYILANQKRALVNWRI